MIGALVRLAAAADVDPSGKDCMRDAKTQSFGLADVLSALLVVARAEKFSHLQHLSAKPLVGYAEIELEQLARFALGHKLTEVRGLLMRRLWHSGACLDVNLVKEPGDRNSELVCDFVQPRCADPGLARFILLNELSCHAEASCQVILAEIEQVPSQAQARSHMLIDMIGLLG